MVSFTCLFITLTLILTATASMLVTFSFMSNYWEYMSYDEEEMNSIAKSKGHTLIRISPKVLKLDTMPSKSTDSVTASPNRTDEADDLRSVVYFFPAHGGVNALCADITEDDRTQMKDDGFYVKPCISYLSNEDIVSVDAWLNRMRNLAMSCSIVCLILLGTSALLGLLGIYKKQISTIMVTGVMYSLAGVFGIFSLAFMYFKRSKADGYFTNTILDHSVPEDYLKARHFAVGWPSSMGWGGQSTTLIASVFWLLLAKILRFQILSPT